MADQLAAAAPDGIDVYFDNVGGDHLEAALSRLNVHGRITSCGMISVYNNTEASAAPRNLALMIGKRITMRGMLVNDHASLKDTFIAEVAPLIASGELRYRENVVDGLAQAPEAFLAMLRGENTGKMLVSI